MGKVIAMAGKGGTGKTTLSALVIRYLQKKGRQPILAVDADPSSNLVDALGLKVNKSLGTAREDFFETKGNLTVLTLLRRFSFLRHTTLQLTHRHAVQPGGFGPESLPVGGRLL